MVERQGRCLSRNPLVAATTGPHVRETAVTDLLINMYDVAAQLRQELSLAEEGLANYAQENRQLKEAILAARRNGSVPEAFWLQEPQTGDRIQQASTSGTAPTATGGGSAEAGHLTESLK
jgi:hypothetical protein